MLTLLKLVENLELSFSQWFLLTRRTQGLTQDDVAEALGISGQSVSNWERGRSVPTLTIDQIKTLCGILNCTLDDFPSSDVE